MLVFNKDKPAERRNQVLFIDASDVKRQRRSAEVDSSYVEKAYLAYLGQNSERSRFVSIEEIEAQDYTLVPKTYLQIAEEKNLPSKEDLEQQHKHFMQSLEQIQTETQQYEQAMQFALQQFQPRGNHE